LIEIDGSKGEGGGQILRTAIALSALIMEPVEVDRIRAGRPKPGLKRQHIAGIELVGRLVRAEISGLDVGSTRVTFRPKHRAGGVFTYDIGTAGSISLVLQAALLPAVLAPEPITFHLRGGTDVPWSPPIDYLHKVFVPVLRKLGPVVSIEQEKRGHYPKGGGQVTVKVTPVREMSPLDCTASSAIETISGISHCVRLPAHVAERQAASAEEVLGRLGSVPIRIDLETYRQGSDPHLGPGSGIVLWAESEEGGRIGADALGARGVRAEEVGSTAATRLLQELATGQPIDRHLGDMIVPYLALANGESRMGITEVTSHLTTNIMIANQVLGAKMSLTGSIGEPGTLSVRGLGLSLPE
jgi:RNA 3'-phosphate cyclase